MAQNLNPNSDGRCVLQFKTGLMSVIKQKLAKRDGARIDRNRDAERLWDFYQKYKRRHQVDDIQREEQRYRESGTFSANLGDLGLRSNETRKTFATLRALVEVMESLSKDSGPNGVGQLITEEFLFSSLKKWLSSSLGLRSNETRKTFATLRALVEVMESLSKDSGPNGVGQLITEEDVNSYSNSRFTTQKS
ncbi:1,3-beta-glucan synthase [Heracleum sosnowskyi]|uniref:1,3-beta-glucan synthase n=1 Tax=Heracleum sosnowskyi TaxID=360622 RepID=A0AAD8M260_9APIA|nr:1,3-beta-glucan synthase [Heracleum sosnowskyi]